MRLIWKDTTRLCSLVLVNDRKNKKEKEEIERKEKEEAQATEIENLKQALAKLEKEQAEMKKLYSATEQEIKEPQSTKTPNTL